MAWFKQNLKFMRQFDRGCASGLPGINWEGAEKHFPIIILNSAVKENENGAGG